MSEGDAQVAASPSTQRLAELSRVITRGIKTVADTTGGPSFADSLASASQSVESDAHADGEVSRTGRRAGESRSGGRDLLAQGRGDRVADAHLTNRLDPTSAGAATTQPGATARPPAATPPVATQSQAMPATTTVQQQTVASGPTYATHGPPGPAASSQVTAQASSSPYPTSTPVRPSSAPPSTSAPTRTSVPASAPVAQAYPVANTVASAMPTSTSAPSTGMVADSRVASTVATGVPAAAIPATATTVTPVATTNVSTTVPALSTTAPTSSTTAAGTPVLEDGSTPSASSAKPLALNQYPTPSQRDRSGVLNWASDSPPTGRDLDRFIAEARHRKAGWVTFVANPDRAEEYGKLADKLTKAGIQPIARVEDPYGDLPVEDVSALVKKLRGHGVRYFQLFDGANVASETPDDRVDVRDYAERWLTAAKAVVDGGGLPGVGALAADGDYDDLGFLRQMLSIVKERGGTDVLGQSWLALRGEQPGATASTSDTSDLADRASWFDRVSRQSLGRSLPILATQDPSGPSERLTGDPARATPTNDVERVERTLRQRRRSLPALFAASRGTLDIARD